MSPQSLEPMRVGMTGVIYLATQPGVRDVDLVWLRAAFQSSPGTRRTEWASQDLLVITQEHVDGIETDSRSQQMPSSEGYQGIFYGRFFGSMPAAHDSGIPTDDILDNFQRRRAAAFADVNGAWAAVIWDEMSRTACFARDQVGIQPLYVGRLPDRIAFSTNAGPLLRSGLFEELSEQAIAEFLHYLYVPAPLTTAKGVQAVLPGHALWLALDGRDRQERFAGARFVRGVKLGTPERVRSSVEENLPRFEEHLLRAVSNCLPRTGRVALALSGGKDSSTLAVALSKICPERVLAFSVGSTDSRFDETSHAALVSRTLGFQFASYVPTNLDLARGLHRFAAVQDLPTGDPAAFPYFLAMSRLPEDCRVILDGTGNDFYFGIPSPVRGLHRYLWRRDVERRLPSWMWFLIPRLMTVGPAWARELAVYWSRPAEEAFVAWHGWSGDELSRLCRREVTFEDTRLWSIMREHSGDDWISLLTEVICSIWEPHTAYRKAVYFGQALGRDVRFPFADDRISRYINLLPEELKFDKGRNKVLLRAYMARHLPDEIVTKPKAPFVFDLNRVLLNPLYSWSDDLTEGGFLRAIPTWTESTIATVRRRHREQPGDARWQHRLYALCLAASVLAARRGWQPPAVRTSDVSMGNSATELRSA